MGKQRKTGGSAMAGGLAPSLEPCLDELARRAVEHSETRTTSGEPADAGRLDGRFHGRPAGRLDGRRA